MGSAISNTRASAEATQTGRERSRPCRRAKLTAGSGSEELDEPALDLLVALLELLGIDGQELEIRELRLVGRILHFGVTRVEPLAVGHYLLELACEGEVREELGGVGMRREAGDRGGRDDERYALLGIDDRDRIALLLHLVVVIVAAVDRHLTLAGGHHAGRIDRRLHEHELVL